MAPPPPNNRNYPNALSSFVLIAIFDLIEGVHCPPHNMPLIILLSRFADLDMEDTYIPC